MDDKELFTNKKVPPSVPPFVPSVPPPKHWKPKRTYHVEEHQKRKKKNES